MRVLARLKNYVGVLVAGLICALTPLSYAQSFGVIRDNSSNSNNERSTERTYGNGSTERTYGDGSGAIYYDSGDRWRFYYGFPGYCNPCWRPHNNYQPPPPPPPPRHHRSSGSPLLLPDRHSR